MHEYNLVQTLLDRAAAVARSHGATSVKAVTVSLGDLAGVEPELLVRAWETFRQRTLCETAPLVVRQVAVLWTCPRCHAVIPAGHLLRCPTCDVPAELEAGGDLVLERLELEMPDV